MHSIPFTYFVLSIAVVLYVTTCFALSRYLDKRDDFADVVWGSVFIVIALCSLAINRQSDMVLNPAAIVVTLVLIWGLRLSIHIGLRFARSQKEDERYVQLRKKWHGNPAVNSYMRIFLLQGFLALVIAMPVIFVTVKSPDYSAWFYAGVTCWLIGFVFEAVADWQLKRFIKDSSNKGRLMTKGLWKYSRHPNYFGELVQWWGLGVVALSVPLGWLALLGPLLLSFLIIKVSGVPLAEARASSKPGWQSYKTATSVLLPLPPKSS